jgi:radical SAM superfamily enzyme YgiQ (UPF0313 family)
LDTDTVESLKETVKLAAEAQLEFAQFSRLTPLPGTAQWKQFQAEGRLTETDWSKFNFQHVCYLPKQMTADDLNKSVSEAWHEFYSYSNTSRRLLRKRPPLTKGNLILWALNLGIARIVSQYGHAKPVRSPNQPRAVFEEMVRKAA